VLSAQILPLFLVPCQQAARYAKAGRNGILQALAEPLSAAARIGGDSVLARARPCRVWALHRRVIFSEPSSPLEPGKRQHGAQNDHGQGEGIAQLHANSGINLKFMP
jgi:hypothetical protein